jgi:hypothetical protein
MFKVRGCQPNLNALSDVLRGISKNNFGIVILLVDDVRSS